MSSALVVSSGALPIKASTSSSSSTLAVSSGALPIKASTSSAGVSTRITSSTSLAGVSVRLEITAVVEGPPVGCPVNLSFALITSSVLVISLGFSMVVSSTLTVNSSRTSLGTSSGRTSISSILLPTTSTTSLITATPAPADFRLSVVRAISFARRTSASPSPAKSSDRFESCAAPASSPASSAFLEAFFREMDSRYFSSASFATLPAPASRSAIFSTFNTASASFEISRYSSACFIMRFAPFISPASSSSLAASRATLAFVVKSADRSVRSSISFDDNRTASLRKSVLMSSARPSNFNPYLVKRLTFVPNTGITRRSPAASRATTISSAFGIFVPTGKVISTSADPAQVAPLSARCL